MSSNSVKQVIIRHTSGPRATQIQQFKLTGLKELTIGQDPDSNIAFEAAGDDSVSRRHALIRVDDNQPSFRLVDLGSTKGTFLNGERITEDVDLLPGDLVGLGASGASFEFDIQPRPANLAPRTLFMQGTKSSTTRLIEPTVITLAGVVSKSNTGTETATLKLGQSPKTSVGLDRIEHKIFEDGRVWKASLGAFVGLAALGVGGTYLKAQHDLYLRNAEHQQRMDELVAHLQRQVAEIEQEKNDLVKKLQRQQGKDVKQQPIVAQPEAPRGITAQEIVDKFGGATAYIARSWRLYDKTTGRPIFHQALRRKEGQTYPAYVLLPDGLGVVRWLTLDPGNRGNIPVVGRAVGTGFTVSEQGFLLTNKHVAAGWNLPFGQEDPANAYRFGWLFDFGQASDSPATLIDLSDYPSLASWIPNGGFVFRPDAALPIGTVIFDAEKGYNHAFLAQQKRNFFGQNDSLKVQFGNSSAIVNARLLRLSPNSDAALIKVDTPNLLKKVELADNYTISVGEHVISVGFTAGASPTVGGNSTDQLRKNANSLPKPLATDGIVLTSNPAIKIGNGVTLGGAQGDVKLLSNNSIGAANSGGPGFNKSGKVIGLLNYREQASGATATELIPIKYGTDLIALSQQP